MIKNIRTYVEKVSMKKGIVQYLERSHIAKKLSDYRANLWDEFVVFNVSLMYIA